MPKVTINDSDGIKQEAGDGLSIETDVILNNGLTMPATALKAATTLTRGGLYTLSGSSLITVTLPKAANVPGAIFILRAASTGAHVVTASQEVSQLHLNYIVNFPSGSAGKTEAGTKLTFPTESGITGSSVTLICDGSTFMVSAASGSMSVTR